MVANNSYGYSEQWGQDMLLQKRAVKAYYWGGRGEADDQTVIYMQATRNWCMAHSERFNEGFVYNFVHLVNLYNTLEQSNKVLENISQAIVHTLACDSLILSDIYRIKADIFWSIGEKYSIEYYIKKALRQGETHQHQTEIVAAKNVLYNFYEDFYLDTRETMMKGFGELCAVSRNEVMNYHYLTYRFSHRTVTRQPPPTPRCSVPPCRKRSRP